MAAPTLYSEEVAAAICERLCDGTPLSVICRDEGMPQPRTVNDWLHHKPEFRASYDAARLVGAQAIAEECLEIADDSSHDWKTGERGGLVTDTEVVQRSKLRIWTRLELLKKWFPQQYGDKMELKHGGTLRVGAAEELSDAELARIAAGSGERAALPPQG